MVESDNHLFSWIHDHSSRSNRTTLADGELHPPAIARSCSSLLLSLATGPIPWPLHPTLSALLPRLQLVADCWHLLADPNGSDRREHYLPRGEREPESAYRRRVEAALPSGFFRDALRTFAGMLASSHWRKLPASLKAVISDVYGCCTDLGVFLEAADLL
ncbi:MAG: hypothetical protein HQ469_02800, partial [Cyanobacteria bacterium]|nr:hypothetical protein [Cyanobacteria bacterium bin.275]